MGVDDILQSCVWLEELRSKLPHPIFANSNNAAMEGMFKHTYGLAELGTYEGVQLALLTGAVYDIATLRTLDFVEKGGQVIDSLLADLKERIPQNPSPLNSIEIYAMNTPLRVARQTYAPEDPETWQHKDGVYSIEEQGVHIVLNHDIWIGPDDTQEVLL